MESYLLESFLPDGMIGADIAAACESASEQGQAVLRHLLVLPEAELCLLVIDAAEPEIACALVRAAGLSIDCDPAPVSLVDVPAVMATAADG